MTEPLWLVLHETFKDAWSGGANTRGAHAAEIKALADWLVPEEIRLKGMRPGGTSAMNPDENRLKERQRLRAAQLAVADELEEEE